MVTITLENKTNAIAHISLMEKARDGLENQNEDLESWVLTSALTFGVLWQSDRFYLYRAPLSQRRFLEASKI